MKLEALFQLLAERVGFEPTVPLLVHELSKLARSATLTPLRVILAFPFWRDGKSIKNS